MQIRRRMRNMVQKNKQKTLNLWDINTKTKQNNRTSTFFFCNFFFLFYQSVSPSVTLPQIIVFFKITINLDLLIYRHLRVLFLYQSHFTKVLLAAGSGKSSQPTVRSVFFFWFFNLKIFQFEQPFRLKAAACRHASLVFYKKSMAGVRRSPWQRRRSCESTPTWSTREIFYESFRADLEPAQSVHTYLLYDLKM